MEIAKTPKRQFLEAPELVRIVAPEASWMERRAWLFQLDESPRWLPLAGKGQVRPPYSRLRVFRQDAGWKRIADGEDSFDQSVESGRQQELQRSPIAGDSRIRTPVVPNGLRKFLERVRYCLIRHSGVPFAPGSYASPITAQDAVCISRHFAGLQRESPPPRAASSPSHDPPAPPPAGMRRNRIRRLALFGSTLEGANCSDSDVDLVVEFEPAATPGLMAISEIESELSALFGGPKVDLRTERDLRRHFRDEVARTAEVQFEA